MVNNPKYILIHCTDTKRAYVYDQFDSVNNYHRDFRQFPVSSLGFYGGYHRIITGGKNRQYRLDGDEGAHCNTVVNGVSMNFQSLGISIGFDGDEELLTKEEEILLRDQIWYWQDKYGIPTENVKFHRDYDKHGKTCPGVLITREWLENLLKRQVIDTVTISLLQRFINAWLKLFSKK